MATMATLKELGFDFNDCVGESEEYFSPLDWYEGHGWQPIYTDLGLMLRDHESAIRETKLLKLERYCRFRFEEGIEDGFPEFEIEAVFDLEGNELDEEVV